MVGGHRHRWFLITALLAFAVTGCGQALPGEKPAVSGAPANPPPAATAATALDRWMTELEQRLSAAQSEAQAVDLTEQALADLKRLADSGSPLAERGMGRLAQTLTAGGQPALLAAATAYLQTHGLAAQWGYLFERPALTTLAVPAAPDAGAGLRPVALRVRPAGQAYALWYAGQADGLLAWRAGDQQAVSLSRLAARELAWAPDGVYFVQLTAVTDGRPRLMRYRWGRPEPELVVDSGRLRGRVRALTWDSAGNRLIWADDGGLKAVAGEGRTLTSLRGPAIPDTVTGDPFAPSGLRYVTVQGDQIVLAVTGQTAVTALAKIGAAQALLRVAWAANGDRVAVEVGAPGQETGRQVAVIQIPATGVPQELLRQDGRQAVLFADRAYYLDAGGRVMEVHLPAGTPRPVAVPVSRRLEGDLVAGHLYLLPAETGQVQVLEVK